MTQVSTVAAAQLFVEELEGSYRQALPAEVLAAALGLVERQVQRGFLLTAPCAAREYLAVRLGALEHEVFAVVFLDAQNRVIEYQEMFRGTVTQTAVYPREVVKAALALNAVGAIFVHFVARHRMHVMLTGPLCGLCQHGVGEVRSVDEFARATKHSVYEHWRA